MFLNWKFNLKFFDDEYDQRIMKKKNTKSDLRWVYTFPLTHTHTHYPILKIDYYLFFLTIKRISNSDEEEDHDKLVCLRLIYSHSLAFGTSIKKRNSKQEYF